MRNGTDQALTESIMKFGDRWPVADLAEIPLLNDRPPFDVAHGFEPEDRVWRTDLLRRISAGQITLPTHEQATTSVAKEALTVVSVRAYHVARVVQKFFDNPNHGNLSDPFLESLFIILTWRSRIDYARAILQNLRKQFRRPRDILSDTSYDPLYRIVAKAGFSTKRPGMIVDLVRQFDAQFPKGGVEQIRSWTDDEVIGFLTAIPGMGVKSSLCVLMYSLGRNRLPIDAHVRRVLRRTGLLKELFDDKGRKEHRVYQDEAEQFVPPSVRKQLHTGFVALGRELCRPEIPRCGHCPIRKVCHDWRQQQVVLAGGRRLSHVQLFCGAGGVAEGFHREGYRTVLAADNDERAVMTYRLNHPEVPEGNVLVLDLDRSNVAVILRKLAREHGVDLAPSRTDVVTAGLPCQGFSKAGYRSRPEAEYDIVDDPRNHLFRAVVKWTKQLGPKYVVIENVPEIRSAGKGRQNILRRAKRSLERLGYTVDTGIINAEHFGVAQTRRRMILLGTRADMPPARVSELDVFHQDKTHLLAAIGDLPQVEPAGATWYMRANGNVITSHRARFNNPDDLKIFAAIRPGERYIDFVERRSDIIHDRRKNSSRAVYSTSSFADKFYKLEPHRPSRTIVAHLNRDGNGYIHPEQARSITPREAARLQGFPDDYIFAGSQTAQYIQIGNAVPPPVAQAVARLLAQKLDRES